MLRTYRHKVRIHMVSVKLLLHTMSCCMRPMLLWMRFIGVFLLPSTGNKNDGCRIWINIYGCLIFFANIFANGLHLAESSSFIAIHQHALPASSAVNVAIGTLNMAATTVLSQLFLILSAINKWPNLMKILAELETFESNNKKTFHRIFLTAFVSVLVFAVLIGVVMVTPVWMLDDWPISKRFYSSFPSFCLLFVFSGGAMFASLTWMASSMLDSLAQQVTIMSSNNTAAAKDNMTNCNIDNWRRQHHLISKFVDEINICYGPLLLVLITSAFVQMIILCHNTMMNVTSNISIIHLLPNVLLGVIQLTFFLSLIYVPHRLRESAIHLSKELRGLQLMADDNNYNKMDLFVMNVLNTLPKITALGFFEVNLQLAPTLIGTTLTYLIILCQFK